MRVSGAPPFGALGWFGRNVWCGGRFPFRLAEPLLGKRQQFENSWVKRPARRGRLSIFRSIGQRAGEPTIELRLSPGFDVLAPLRCWLFGSHGPVSGNQILIEQRVAAPAGEQ